MKEKHKLGFKILIGIMIILVITGLSIAVWYYSTVNSLNKANTPQEAVIGSGEKQALMIYQPTKADSVSSATMSSGTIIAETLASRGYTVTVNFPSEKLDYDLEDYDVIVFGSPVYSGKLSPVLKKYVENNPISQKHILFFVSGMYPDDEKELRIMETWINENNDVAAVKTSKDENNKLASFITQVLDKWGDNS